MPAQFQRTTAQQQSPAPRQRGCRSSSLQRTIDLSTCVASAWCGLAVTFLSSHKASTAPQPAKVCPQTTCASESVALAQTPNAYSSSSGAVVSVSSDPTAVAERIRYVYGAAPIPAQVHGCADAVGLHAFRFAGSVTDHRSITSSSNPQQPNQQHAECHQHDQRSNHRRNDTSASAQNCP